MTDQCAHCGSLAKPGQKLSLCASCWGAKYCSKECQTAAWPAHKVACKATDKLDTLRASPLLAMCAGFVAQHPNFTPEALFCNILRRERVGRELHLYLSQQTNQPIGVMTPDWDKTRGTRLDPSKIDLLSGVWHDQLGLVRTVGTLLGFHHALAQHNAAAAAAGYKPSAALPNARPVALTFQGKRVMGYGVGAGRFTKVDHELIYHTNHGTVFRGTDPDRHAWMYWRTDDEVMVLDVGAAAMGLHSMVHCDPYLPEDCAVARIEPVRQFSEAGVPLMAPWAYTDMKSELAMQLAMAQQFHVPPERVPLLHAEYGRLEVHTLPTWGAAGSSGSSSSSSSGSSSLPSRASRQHKELLEGQIKELLTRAIELFDTARKGPEANTGGVACKFPPALRRAAPQSAASRDASYDRGQESRVELAMAWLHDTFEATSLNLARGEHHMWPPSPGVSVPDISDEAAPGWSEEMYDETTAAASEAMAAMRVAKAERKAARKAGKGKR